eukprot:1084753_1
MGGMGMMNPMMMGMMNPMMMGGMNPMMMGGMGMMNPMMMHPMMGGMGMVHPMMGHGKTGGNTYHFHVYGKGSHHGDEHEDLKELNKEISAQEATAERVKKANAELLDRYSYYDEDDWDNERRRMMKMTHNIDRAPRMVRDEVAAAAAVAYDDNSYEESAFLVYKRFINGVNHMFYSNDNNWDEIRFTANDDIQKCNNALHKHIRVCFCEDEDEEKPFECNQKGEQYSAAKLFPFMNTLRMNEENIDSLSGQGQAMQTLAEMSPEALKEMDDYSFMMRNPMAHDEDESGANPMKVNVHFEYPSNYKDRIENGAFGAKEGLNDMMNDYEYLSFDEGNEYFAYDASYDDDNDEDYAYEYDDDETAAAFINIGYDQIDKDMRISIDKANAYVPYVNPDLSGFRQKVRISWNTFWKLQLFAIIGGVALFVSISMYFNNPFKHFEIPSFHLSTHVKVFDNNDDNINIVDYEDYDQHENQQLKQ